MAVGLSPQVVTETLWALAIDRDPAWTPHQIVVLTTAEGDRLVRTKLIDQRRGQIRALGRVYGRQDLADLALNTRVEVISDRNHSAVDDLNTDDAHLDAANKTLGLVRELTSDPDTEVHASIAGGRKSQGALIALSMSMLGRPADEMSHVMVDDHLVGREDFYFPVLPAIGRGGSDIDGTGMSPSVRLCLIPFPRLRTKLGVSLRDELRFSDTVKELQNRLDGVNLLIDAVKRAISLDGTALTLAPSLFAWFAALAWDRLQAGPGLPRTGLSNRTLERWKSGPLESVKIVDSERVQEWTSRINKLVKEDTAIGFHRNIIDAFGRRPMTRYRLSIEARDIHWTQQ